MGTIPTDVSMLIRVVSWVLEVLIYLILGASILSWFQPSPRNPLVRAIHAVVDPLLHPIRALLPRTGALDFSPMIAILLLVLLKSLINRSTAL